GLVLARRRDQPPVGRIGERPDLIEVSPEDADFAPAGRVPQPDALVSPATGQLPAVGSKLDVPDQGSMVGQALNLPQVLEVPDSNGSVGAPRRQGRFVRSKRQRTDPLFVPRE